MANKKNLNSSIEQQENTCVVCFKNAEIYSIGDCDHSVCFECSTRMRVLCCQNECPICRRDMPNVIFTKLRDSFLRLKSKALAINLLDKKYGIYFMSNDIQTAYERLLEHRCQLCDRTELFSSFFPLREHMRRQHELFNCELCTDNLKIFSFERRWYNRTQLAQHRRKGDTDDKSHKGHPLCEFCDQRFMDSDELYRHLRRQHLYCHFCDADGKHHYYSSYNYLREHFQTEHFLCEEGDCKDEQFTSVFRTEIDLKAHKASVHGKQLGKIGAKQARTLELEFRLAPRPRAEQNQQAARQSRIPPPQTLGQHMGIPPPNVIDDWPDASEGAVGFSLPSSTIDDTIIEPPVSVQKKLINALDPDLFPTLSGSSSTPLTSVGSKPLTRTTAGGGSAGITIRHTRQGLAKTDENFPALSNDVPTSTSSTLRFSVNAPSSSIGSNGKTTKGPNVSVHVNHRPSSISTGRPTIGLTARVYSSHVPSSEPTEKIATRESTSEAFPALGGSLSAAVQPAQWITPKSKSKKSSIPPTLTEQQPPIITSANINSTKDFPTLSGNSLQKSDKSLDLNKKVPATNSWSSEESTSTKSTTSLTETKSKNKKKKSKSENNSTPTISTPINKVESKKSLKTVNGSNSTKNTIGALDNNVNTTKNDKKKTTKSTVPDEKDKKDKQIKNSPVKNNAERKRSELTIGNLQTPTVNGATILQENDFPALSKTKPVKKPPGFESWPVKSPPPGFINKTESNNTPSVAPPPGFNMPANDLTFTNSSGQKYSILPLNNNNNNNKRETVFYSPPNFNQRNKKLIQNFMTALSDNDLNEFRQLSHMFKQGTYSAKNYYDYCRKCLGEQFQIIFPELLALLPDISKQNELFNVHKKRSNKNEQLDKCAVCGQIVIANDLRHHVANHTLENHFPVLGSGNSASGDISTAWKK